MENLLELTSEGARKKELTKKIEADAGVNFTACYQCGKCTAGCPVAFAMDVVPRKIMRFLQLGMADKALNSKTIWLCASCDTCSTRCPRGVDIAKVMEALRITAKKQNIISEKNIDLFSDLFLKSVKNNGRVHEMGLMVAYNIKSGQFLKDAMLAPKLFLTGKISPFPEKIHDGGAVKRIFAKTLGGEK